MRKRLLAQREAFVAGAGFDFADAALAQHLTKVLSELEPQSLGLYWAHRSEFNAAGALGADALSAKWPIALPFAQRAPVQMHYRVWDGRPPLQRDECGLATGSGAAIVPDVVLVPCVGFTAAGFRLGYGGGYFDRWLAQHPHVTAVGVAWACAEIGAADFTPAPHDLPLTLIVTERGVA